MRLPSSFLPMSEENISPKKKAVRKSARKKSAKKAAKEEASEAPQEQSLPLIPDVPAAESAVPEKKEQSEKSDQKRSRPQREPRGPKKSVRDTRKEGDQDAKSDDSDKPLESPQESSRGDDDQDGRGRGRNRGRGRGRGRSDDAPQNQKPRTPIDEEQLKKKAWKIYLSEVTEEGLALLDDNGLRTFARGSFQAARVFLEEEQKH